MRGDECQKIRSAIWPDTSRTNWRAFSFKDRVSTHFGDLLQRHKLD